MRYINFTCILLIGFFAQGKEICVGVGPSYVVNVLATTGCLCTVYGKWINMWHTAIEHVSKLAG